MNTRQPLIAEIRETGRMQQALLHAEGSLTRQIKAIEKRFKQSIEVAGHGMNANRDDVASHLDPLGVDGLDIDGVPEEGAEDSTLSVDGGHDYVADHEGDATTNTSHSDVGHIRGDNLTKAADAATLKDAASQHKGDPHIMIAGGVDSFGGADQVHDVAQGECVRAATLNGNAGHDDVDGHDLYAGVSPFSGEQDQDIDAHLKDIVELATLPLTEARKVIRKQQMALRRRLESLAVQLPGIEFVDGVYGFGRFGFAMIIAEAGDLSSYATVSRLWKRMGLAVIDGRAQRRVANKEEAERHGFNPIRRALMHTLGDSLFKKQNLYRDIYLERKELEELKLPDSSKMHRHKRALRYMEKRLLRDLWRAWRDAAGAGELEKAA